MVVGSFPDNIIPGNVSSPVIGTMYVSTIGWMKRSPTYLLAILPITIIAILTLACAVYSIEQAWKEWRKGSQRTTFDVSNTLHLIMASAAGSLRLNGFNDEGISHNEDVRIQLDEQEQEQEVVGVMTQIVVMKFSPEPTV